MDFIKNVSITFIAKVFMFFTGAIASILIFRILGPTRKGVYTLVFLVPSLAVIFGDFGIGMANTYFVGKKKDKITHITSNSLIFGFLNSVFLVVLFLLFYKYLIGAFFGGINSILIYLVLLIVPFSLVSNYLEGILLAKFKIKELNLLLVFTSLVNLLGVVLLLVFLNKGVLSLILLAILTSIIMFTASVFLVSKLTNVKYSFNLSVFRESISYGIKGYFGILFNFLNYRLDMLLVNFFIGVTQVGYYSLAVHIAELVWFIPGSLRIILFPEITSSDSQKKSDELTAIVCRNTVFITFLLCIGLAIFGKVLIKIVYGSAYLPAFIPLFILLPGMITMSISQIIGAYLLGVGRPTIATIGSLVVLIINIILNILLIPKYGITGAALATTIGYTAGATYALYVYIKLSKMGLLDTLIVKPSDFNFYLNYIKRNLRSTFLN